VFLYKNAGVVIIIIVRTHILVTAASRDALISFRHAEKCVEERIGDCANPLSTKRRRLVMGISKYSKAEKKEILTYMYNSRMTNRAWCKRHRYPLILFNVGNKSLGMRMYFFKRFLVGLA